MLYPVQQCYPPAPSAFKLASMFLAENETIDHDAGLAHLASAHSTSGKTTATLHALNFM